MNNNTVSIKAIILIIVITLVYITLNVWMMNYSLFITTVFGSYSIVYKFKLLFSLLEGMWMAMSGFSIVMLIIVALLTGINLTLIIQRIRPLRSFSKSYFAAGGASAVGFIGSGCAACGLPILSLLGLSGSVAYLPFGGVELSFISSGLLLLSLYLIMKNSSKDKVCKTR